MKSGPFCHRCDGTVSLRDPNTLYEVSGWERKRAQGGQNHVLFRRETGRLMCGKCSLRMRYAAGQGEQLAL